MQLQGAVVARHRPGRGRERPAPVAAAGVRRDRRGGGRAAPTLVLLLTEWREYRDLDPVVFGKVVAQKSVLDGRNALDREAWTAAGWSYRALGRRAG